MTPPSPDRVHGAGRTTPLPAGLALMVALLAAPFAGCRARAACDGIACAPVCPRDAERDGSGRCACVAGTLPVLGACVPPAIADAYCGPAARGTASGCVARTCSPGEKVDVSTGVCGSAGAGSSSSPCADGGAVVVSGGRAGCIPASAVCPRGTVRKGSDGTVCARPAACPPGSLPESIGAEDGGAAACRPVVMSGAHGGMARVDVGAWAAIAFGPDGGPGSGDLCAPLSLRPDVFALPEGAPAAVAIRIVVLLPDEDLTRVHVRVESELESEAGERPLSAEGAALVELSVGAMIEPLRSLGGEASTAALELSVRCEPKSL